MNQVLHGIVFSTKDVSNFKERFTKLMDRMSKEDPRGLEEILPEFKVDYSEERIVICLPKTLSSFSFLAEVLDSVNNFKVAYNTLMNVEND